VQFVAEQLNAYERERGQIRWGLLGFATAILEYARWSRNIRPFRSWSINNRDMSDFRNLRNYRSPRFLDWSILYMSGAVWIYRKIKSPPYNFTQRTYFRFAPAILQTDLLTAPVSDCRNPPGKHVGRMGNRAQNNFWFAAATCLESTAVALHRWNTSSKHVKGSL